MIIHLRRPLRTTKVLYFEPLGVAGGMGGYNQALFQALARLLPVDMMAPESSSWFVQRLAAWAFNRRLPRTVRGLSYALLLLVAASRLRPRDILVLHFSHVPLLDLVLVRWAAWLGCRNVFIAHDPEPLAGSATRHQIARLFRSADLVITHGPVAAETIRRNIGSDGGSSATRHRGQAARGPAISVRGHPDFLPAQPMYHQEAEVALGLEVGAEPVVGLIGSIRHSKDVARTAEAVLRSRLQVTVLVAGGPVSGAEDEVDRLRQLASQYPERLSLRIGRMTHRQELAAYSVSSIVVCAYRQAFSSGVVARAHAIGRPVVATEVGDLPSQMRDGDVALPVDWGPRQLAIAVDQALGGLVAPRWSPIEDMNWRRIAEDIYSVVGESPAAKMT